MGTTSVGLDALISAISGRVITSEAPDYDEQRAQYNGMIDRRPQLIVRIADEADAARSIAYAREHALPIAIRAGGHSSPGHGVVDDGLVIDVRDLTEIVVDPEARTVRCGAGVDWGQFDRATQEHGLAVTGGRISSTGVTGLTIGSGSGWLERVMGLTSDSLIGLRIVTAAGEVVVADEEENAELLWASRGGGGNFGVITELTFALQPLGPQVLGGARFYPIERAVEVAQAYRDLNRTAPAELCTGLTFQVAPPAPFLPEAVHGKSVATLFVIWAGEIGPEAEAGIALLDQLGEPMADIIAPTPYADLQAMADASYPYGNRDYFKGGFINELTDGAIEALVGFGADLKAPRSNLILLPMGENTHYATIGEETSPLGYRDAQWSFQVLSLWEDAAEDDLHRDWTRHVAETMSSYSSMVAFPNFIAGQADELSAAEKAFTPTALARLRAAKRTWDPDNVFARNVVSLV